jgi:hypothetical protein
MIIGCFFVNGETGGQYLNMNIRNASEAQEIIEVLESVKKTLSSGSVARVSFPIPVSGYFIANDTDGAK